MAVAIAAVAVAIDAVAAATVMDNGIKFSGFYFIRRFI